MKYVRLLKEFIRAAVVEEFEYRSNFFANVLGTVSGLFFALLTLQVFFLQTEQIGGWSFEQVLVLLGVFNALSGVVSMVLRPNIGRIVQHIRKGTLDFILTKPVDSQFFISFRHIVFWPVSDVLVGFGMIIYGGWKMGVAMSLFSVLWFLVIFLAAVVTLYSLWFLMMTLSFWFVKVENLTLVFTSLFETARFPVQVYKGWLRVLLTYLFPVAVLTTFPAAAFTGGLSGREALISLLMAGGLLVLSRLFWKTALRNYQSASS
ncbi:multidrug transporter [Tumebacillus algifaecis]|uniref:Multidrug transporter n=1 Tax=Tumebacillus algifaecis TaxID=1214604 RepID=A0A223D3A9_9BACL|nr:ABC-2 family transporter protein [Tumebacillus algifaecis]ASS76138.1 multidrug transporter [Tumebacillus algifaecis]